MQKSVFYYMRANILITTSGVFDQATLNCAIAELGIDVSVRLWPYRQAVMSSSR
jgi:hypothetical protein